MVARSKVAFHPHSCLTPVSPLWTLATRSGHHVPQEVPMARVLLWSALPPCFPSTMKEKGTYPTPRKISGGPASGNTIHCWKPFSAAFKANVWITQRSDKIFPYVYLDSGSLCRFCAWTRQNSHMLYWSLLGALWVLVQLFLKEWKAMLQLKMGSPHDFIV